jgi:hypothetical protein
MSVRVDFRVALVGPGRQVILCVFHFVSHVLHRLAHSDDVRSITRVAMTRDMRAFARERRLFGEALVDPFSTPSGTLYIGYGSDIGYGSETEPFVENAIAIFHSRLFPGYAEYFPGSGAKNSRLCRNGNLPASH